MSRLFLKQYIILIFLSLFVIATAVTITHAEDINTDTSIQSEPEEEDSFEEFGDFEEFQEDPQSDVYDPLSGYNRFMTNVNDKLYHWFVKPVATGYGKVVPEPGRRAINRFFNNAIFPIRFVNNLLQLKLKQTGIETVRFGMNTTVGIVGLFDPAKAWLDLEPYNEDFGQTVGHYGVGSGFHFVIPILGPSNLRDTIGRIPDYFLHPVVYTDYSKFRASIESYRIINYTSMHLGEDESIQKDALDFYTFMRDAYEQNRNAKIKE